MKVLLDECLPKKLKLSFPDHEVKTVPEMDWSGKKNGELLALACEQFDCFLTVDQGLSYQQNLEKTKIPIVVISANNSRLESFHQLVPKINDLLQTKLDGIVVVS